MENAYTDENEFLKYFVSKEIFLSVQCGIASIEHPGPSAVGNSSKLSLEGG